MATKVEMCRAVCSSCRRDFPYPFLGDFSYGCFILHREDGRAFRYLRAIDHQVWNFVAGIAGDETEPRNITRPSVLQEVVARLADRPEGLTFTMEMVCPYCKSRLFSEWGDESLSSAEIPDATFDSFIAMDVSAKEHLVRELIKTVKSE